MAQLQPLEVEAEIPAVASPRAGRTKLLRLIWYGILALAVMAGFSALYFARAIFVPIALAILLNLLLGDFVRLLARIRVPAALGAAIVLIAFVGGIGLATYQLAGPAAGWIEGAPYNLSKIQEKLRPVQETVDEVKRTTERVEKMAETGNGSDPKVTVKGPSLTESFLSGAGRAASTIGITIVLLYFLLASGDLFLRKLVKVLPTFQDKKRAVEIARQAEADVSRYLVTVTLVNLGLGAFTGLAMFALGMPNPMLWGALAALANFIPYLGAMSTTAVLAIVAAVTFDELSAIVAPPAVFLLLTTLEGQFVTPMLLGRRLTLNPVVIFIALLVWGWLWGVPGVLMAVPLLAAFKIMCDHVPSLAAVGEFLGRKDSEVG
jgi:predicted PurR-regulated permease PerM